jgi:hypothetical protein
LTCLRIYLQKMPSRFAGRSGLSEAHSHGAGFGEEVEMSSQPSATSRVSTDIGPVREKLTAVADVNPSDDFLDEQDEAVQRSKSTSGDAADMKRMGKEQQLVRHFRLVSTMSFVAISTAAWEVGLFVITPALTDGGRAGLVWNVLWNIIGFGPIYLSMAEMASMAPIAGAQYHWVRHDRLLCTTVLIKAGI